MKYPDILRLRLANQHISSNLFTKASQIVSSLGAIQAQDFAGAKWSLGLRSTKLSEKDIDQAISNRSIVRSWPMRGTLHFVAAQDLHWMLSLLAPRILAKSAGRNRQLALDQKVLDQCKDLLIQAMTGNQFLTRTEVYDLLENQNISTAEQRGIHILNYLAMNRVICHGPHLEKQPTYVLLDEWVSSPAILSEEESLHQIALTFFTSHGPATLQDFIWWTGLTITLAKKALSSVASRLSSVVVDANSYWFSPELPDLIPSKTVHMLPGFDEYMLGYTNRELMVTKSQLSKIVPGNNGMFMPTIVIDGKVVGLWKRTLKKDQVYIELQPFDPLSKSNLDKLQKVALRYGKFLNKEAVINL